jgi:hypothetical protein
MKNLLSAAVAVVALSAILPNTSIAEPATGEIGIEATLAELQQRIEELEARVGGKSLSTAFRGRNRVFGHVTQSTIAAEPE